MNIVKILAILGCVTVSSAQQNCNHDNCYRALFPTASPAALSTASAFCTSLLSGPVTRPAPSAYPSRATSACGTSPARYSSACSCIVPSCSTDTAAQPIKNGGFECGLYPWSVNTTDRATFAVNLPGYTGQNAFSLTTIQNTADWYPPYIEQTAVVTLGQQYTLTFWTWFGDSNAGFIGLMLNGIPRATDDARDDPCCQIWNKRIYSFTAGSAKLLVHFDFLATSGGHTFKIDQITLN